MAPHFVTTTVQQEITKYPQSRSFPAVIELLFNSSESIDPGPTTAFMKTPDGFASIVTKKVRT